MNLFISRFRQSNVLAVLVLAVLVLVVAVLVAAPAAQATPGNGTYMRYVHGSQPINGGLYLYNNWSYSGISMTAGSGTGPNWNNPCVYNEGHLPEGWYSTNAPYHHKNNLDNSEIKGRVWYLNDKAQPSCPTHIRTGLFVHTEETKTMGQDCPTEGDDKFCWESAAWDYRSAGCVKVSHPNNGFPDSIGVLDTWWSNQGGGHGVAYSNMLCVVHPGTCVGP